MIVFGPVPSRRLGQSLGINNIPPKVCTYSCVYCQIGRTSKMQMQRQEFYDPKRIVKEVQARMASLASHGEEIDYLSFVPDGEPTLDIRIGETIDLLKEIGIPIAVITNASLLWIPDVREDISKADWVSVKIDAATDQAWHKINRPHRELDHERIIDGVGEFAKIFRGCLTTETMLVRGINDNEEEIKSIATMILKVSPNASYISVATRPPAESWVKTPSEASLAMAHHIFVSSGLNAELLIGYGGNSFGFTGDVESDILTATAVHPMRERSVDQLLARAGASWETVEDLVASGKLVRIQYAGEVFYIRSLPGIRKQR